MKNLVRAAVAATFALTLVLPVLSAEVIKGEVQKIDDATGKVTLKHGAAKSLGMDAPMTMVYRVKDPAMLQQVKVGDKVEFEAEEAAAGYTVTKIQKAK